MLKKTDNEVIINQAAINLHARLCSLQGHALYKAPLVANFNDTKGNLFINS